MQRVTRVVCAVVVLGFSVPAWAQDRPFLSAAAGASLNQQPGAVVQFGAGAGVVPRLVLVGEVAYFRDALPDAVRDAADEVAGSFERFNAAVFGRTIDVDVDAAAPTLLGTVGLRFVPWPARFRPFIQVDAGVARVTPRIKYVADGADVSGALAPPVGGAESKPAFGIGGGFDAALSGQIGIEARYRFMRVFADRAFEIYRVRGFNVNAVTAGVRWEF